MTPVDSPEWLPSGWTVKTNVLKTGRRTEYYLNSETGQKFFSKDDLIHHVRVQGLELGHSQPEKRKVESDSKNNHQIDVVRDIYECPDWLPHDWIIEVKTRNSGGEKGRIYKCFVELATGRKFYSKPEVIKYLKNVKRASTKPKEASISAQPSSKVAFEKSTVEDLPPGWIKEVKITKSACKTRKDPYYTDPITGYVFRSKREVERYLETGEISRHAFLPKKRLLIDQDLSSPSTEREVINGLPARGQFLSGEHTGADKVSSDKINALSTPEASIKASGEILQAETVPPVTSTAKISSQNHSRDHASDSGGKCEKSSDITVLAQPVPAGHLDGKVDTDEGSGLTYESDIKHEQDSLKDGKERAFQQKGRSSLSKSRNKKGLNLPRRTSKRLAGVEPLLAVNPVSSIVELDLAADPLSSIVEPDVAANPVSIVEALRDPAVACSNEGCAVNASADEPILNSEADIKQEDFDGNRLKDSSKVKAKNSSSKPAKRKMLNLPRRTSKRLAGLVPESLPNSVSGAHAQNVASSSKDQAAVSAYSKLDDLPSLACQKHETEAAEQRENVSHYLQGEPSQTKQIHQQVVPSEQSEGLDTDKDTNKISVPKISPPFEEFLADPCLEFAYKTLTGAIPFEKAAHSMLFSNPANIMNEKKSHVNSIEENSNRKSRTKSSKCKNRKESAPRRSSKQKVGFQLNPVSNSITHEASLYIATTKSGKSKAGRRSASARNNAGGVSQQVDVDTGMVRVHHGFPDIKTSHGWPVNRSKQPLDSLNFSGDHPLKPEQKPFFSLTGEQAQRPELQSSFLAGEFWSDPCLEFAFKTLTGSLPVEDNLLPPGYFQQQVNSYQPQRESYFQQPVETYPSQRDGNLALPDFGFPSFSQTDISAHFDSLEKPVSQLQSSNSSVMPSGSANLPSCGSIASQAPHIDGNKGLRGKVNS